MSPFSDRNFLCVDNHRGEGKMTSGFSKSDSNIANSGSEYHPEQQCLQYLFPKWRVVVVVVKHSLELPPCSPLTLKSL